MLGLPPTGRVARPDDIARLALFFASEQSDHITGQAWNVDGGVRDALNPFRFSVNVREAPSRARRGEDKTARGRRARLLHAAGARSPGRHAGHHPGRHECRGPRRRRLRVGTNVLNNDLRHPVLLAREAATMDLLTDGPDRAGAGRGLHAGSNTSRPDSASIVDASGSSGSPRRSSIIKGLLGGAEVNFAGQHYRVTGHRIHPLPVQRPHPPIIGRRQRSPPARAGARKRPTP